MLVILILALISVLVLAWAHEWRMELKLTTNFRRMNQSRRLAEAGVYYAIGKLVAAKVAETKGNFSGQVVAPENLWRGDQSPHVLEFPEGMAEISIAEESGKINLNRATGAVLRSLFTVLGIAEPQLSIMVDSIEDWRSRGDRPHPYGAKSDYYLGLEPPYVAKNGKFEVVEELAWVRGFEASPLLPRLGNWLTVFGIALNVNTAPLEVLEAMGFAPEIASTIILTRQTTPFKDFQEIAQLSGKPLFDQTIPLSFQTSQFFTITSRGQVRNQGHYTIKAIIRLDDKRDNLWEIISWFDGFPNDLE